MLVLRRAEPLAWTAAAWLCLLAIAGDGFSRPVGLPGLSDHIGHWGEPAGLASLFYEGAVIGFAVASGARPPVVAAAAPGVWMAIAVAALLGIAAGGFAQESRAGGGLAFSHAHTHAVSGPAHSHTSSDAHAH